MNKNNAEARQRIIKELYDRFFNVAFKKMAERLGIVYTPIEVVDFIIQSVEDVMKDEFGKSLSDKDVHILDPFTGTGTFVVRLLQSGIIKKEDLKRKFSTEIHANELVLLAYYIATINIEETYHELAGGSYVPFEGAILTDTFQLTEVSKQTDFTAALPEIHKRAEKQQKAKITIVISNPPYSAGQADENENNQNLDYPNLDKKIENTYAKLSTATLKSSLYDSYIRGIKWATERIGDEGIVGFVTNGSFIDSRSSDGLRKSLSSEFSRIYCFNLRGNQRTSGELSRQEGGKIFGSGSRTPVAITIFIKTKGHKGPADIFYHDIGDYLSRDEKINLVSSFKSIKGVPWTRIAPNPEGDWVNQRSVDFDAFIPIGDKKGNSNTIFDVYSQGILTCRDYWCFNSSKAVVQKSIKSMIGFYNEQVKVISNLKDKDEKESALSSDSRKISWSANLKTDALKNTKKTFNQEAVVQFMYRPFLGQWGYFHRSLNERVYQMPKIFPTPSHNNLMICIIGPGETNRFSILITSRITEYKTFYNSQCFPLHFFEKYEEGQLLQKNVMPDDQGYIRRDAVTDFSLDKFQASYMDKKIVKEDIFYYIYGLLHSPTYRTKYQNDLKKMLPRIPLLKDFWGYSKTGRQLAEVHLNYETIKPYKLQEIISINAPKEEKEIYRVNESGMKFVKNKKIEDRTKIIYNPHVRLEGIPIKAYEYEVNGKSAIEWIMERYRITKDLNKKGEGSGIVNDPNEWSDDPRYIIDLLKRIVTVSVETNKLVSQLPSFDLL